MEMQMGIHLSHGLAQLQKLFEDTVPSLHSRMMHLLDMQLL